MRKKPKRCDFLFNKKRYWVSVVEWFDVSDSDNTDDWCLSCNVKNWDTDEDVGIDQEEWNSDEFMDKAFSKAERLEHRPSHYTNEYA